jgi:hypothetical protein
MNLLMESHQLLVALSGVFKSFSRFLRIGVIVGPIRVVFHGFLPIRLLQFVAARQPHRIHYASCRQPQKRESVLILLRQGAVDCRLIFLVRMGITAGGLLVVSATAEVVSATVTLTNETSEYEFRNSDRIINDPQTRIERQCRGVVQV